MIEHYPTTPVQCVCGWRETDNCSFGTWTSHLSHGREEQIEQLFNDLEQLLDNLGRGNGYGGSACGVCHGHSPSWDGHSRNCKNALPDRLRALIAKYRNI